MEQQDMFDQLLNGHIEDGEPQKLEPYHDKYGRKYYPSVYTNHEHKGWFWNEELFAYQRWQDMMDWYHVQKSKKLS